jgi:ubiquinone/menaquinone biosynthesis C-methylase UbiE
MSKTSEHTFDPAGFSDVDATGTAAEYFSFLEQTGARLRERSRQRYALLDLHDGDSVLELGCGLGDDARGLALLVGPHGNVVGVDSSAAMVEEARKRTGQSVPAIEFVVGDAHALQFADQRFDACWTERVLEHLADPALALAEMVRVTKSGGRIVVFEPDHDTLVIDAADRATTKIILTTLAQGIRSGWIGRALFGLFRANGLQDVKVVPTPIVSNDLTDTNALLRLDAAAATAVQRGLLSEQAVSQWLADLEQRHAARRFFACLLCFTAFGKKA